MKIELTKDEIQTTANALFEFAEQIQKDSTRDEELKKVRILYKKLYGIILNGKK